MWYKTYEDRRYIVLRYRKGDIRVEVLFDRKVNKYTGAWVDIGDIDHPWHKFKKPTRHRSIAKDRALTLVNNDYHLIKYIYET